ncbi:Vms1/Ankzf1 family peptidyl-tRNA hydrolase [Ilumatobacter sp.]|uniref:baeRF2 domain-containing protein n=1 Tax=Ilumatobacter sp. TaxID=1967498 RepID=UPI003C57B643
MRSTLARTSTMTDLRDLVGHDGPFLTALIPARSDVAGAADRFDVQIHNALRSATVDWASDVTAMTADLEALDHGDGASVIAIRPRSGPTFVEFIDQPVRRPSLTEGPLPRLAPLIEARQRVLPHVVVETDLAGADLIAFDGGSVTATHQVDGNTLHIHRGHPGGWSQRRFQQRAENTWDDNIEDVADAVSTLVDEVGARIVAVVGPTRAQSMLVDLLDDQLDVPVHAVGAGDADGAADEIVRLVANIAAGDTKALLDEFRERVDHRTTTSLEVTNALAEGRVETLLVHDDESNDSGTIDRAIRQALLTDADIHVIPNVASLDDGLAAILRW